METEGRGEVLAPGGRTAEGPVRWLRINTMIDDLLSLPGDADRERAALILPSPRKGAAIRPVQVQRFAMKLSRKMGFDLLCAGCGGVLVDVNATRQHQYRQKADESQGAHGGFITSILARRQGD